MDEYTRRALANSNALQTITMAALVQALESKGILTKAEFETAYQRVLNDQSDAILKESHRKLKEQEEAFQWGSLGIGDLWGRTGDTPIR